MLTRMIRAALPAALGAALLLTLAQEIWVMPLLLQAERWEQGPARTSLTKQEETSTKPDIARAEPTDLRRMGLRLLINSSSGLGFALLLVVAYTLRGRNPGLRASLLWGLAGYTAFVAAPALGLPPTPPGAQGAALEARQLWWLLTVCATLAGLGLMLLNRRIWSTLAGGALLVFPHALGAPASSIATKTLGGQTIDLERPYAWAVLGCNLLFWLCLGALSSWSYQRWYEE